MTTCKIVGMFVHRKKACAFHDIFRDFCDIWKACISGIESVLHTGTGSFSYINFSYLTQLNFKGETLCAP